MDLNSIGQLATVLAGLATVIGLLWGVHVYRRQMNAQVFLTYTERYERIMAELPLETRRARLDLSSSAPPRSEELSLAVLRYLNLCSEEFYLRKVGHLDRRIWKIWEEELRRTLRSPLVRREWPQLQSEFDSYTDFRDFVDKELRHFPAGEASPIVLSAVESTEVVEGGG